MEARTLKAMKWLVIKLFLQKTLLWLRTYWYFPLVLLYTIVLWVVFRKDATTAIGVLEIRSDSYKKQIHTLDQLHKAEAEEKKQLNKKFDETLKKIDVELEKRNEVLDRNKKKRVKEIVEKHSDDPKRLAQLVKESFGFEIVE